MGCGPCRQIRTLRRQTKAGRVHICWWISIVMAGRRVPTSIVKVRWLTQSRGGRWSRLYRGHGLCGRGNQRGEYALDGIIDLLLEGLFNAGLGVLWQGQPAPLVLTLALVTSRAVRVFPVPDLAPRHLPGHGSLQIVNFVLLCDELLLQLTHPGLLTSQVHVLGLDLLLQGGQRGAGLGPGLLIVLGSLRQGLYLNLKLDDLFLGLGQLLSGLLQVRLHGTQTMALVIR